MTQPSSTPAPRPKKKSKKKAMMGPRRRRQWKKRIKLSLTGSLMAPTSYNEVLQLMINNGINHCDVNGITQKINDLHLSYKTSRNWKRNTRAGILGSNMVNGVKTVKGN
ncbi:hypothetical protein VP01_5906g1 [Puccinia sorghi]|uniref:Uncharacterized protein n=1 Tax=Puccinia sorghi TaxID=27349 RepID=A0A0L6UHV1_9BASI|nr:hypothetical protein VP01_5906g1 [Puccinia sorghi]